MLLLGLSLGWWVVCFRDRGEPSSPAPVPEAGPPPRVPSPPVPPLPVTGGDRDQAETGFPPELVFARVFWRRPDAGDRILHAERREWSDGDGVTRWQVFLAVEPGPALAEWLATNPFSLVTVTALERDIPDPPPWFPKPAAAGLLQQSPVGNLVVMTASGGRTVFVSDHDRGFSRPVPVPAPGESRPPRKAR
jgi:hypothetical protein